MAKLAQNAKEPDLTMLSKVPRRHINYQFSTDCSYTYTPSTVSWSQFSSMCFCFMLFFLGAFCLLATIERISIWSISWVHLFQSWPFPQRFIIRISILSQVATLDYAKGWLWEWWSWLGYRWWWREIRQENHLSYTSETLAKMGDYLYLHWWTADFWTISINPHIPCLKVDKDGIRANPCRAGPSRSKIILAGAREAGPIQT